MENRIITTPAIFAETDIPKIETHYDATYICETCLRGKAGWVNEPVAVFWNKDEAKVPPGGSRWFGLFFSYQHVVSKVLAGGITTGGSDVESVLPPPLLAITNAISAVETPITGIIADNGDIIYSRYRHDYRQSPDGSVWIDGGRDYTRTRPCPNGMVELQIVDDELKVIKGM